MNSKHRPTVVLDANVLYSGVLTDYFVQARAQNLVVLRWSPEIVEEMIRNKKRKARERFTDPSELEPRLANFDRLRQYIEQTYPDEFVEPSTRDFVPFKHLPMKDPDDRHVIATAVAARAEYICTDDEPGFPDAVMAAVGIRRITPDKLLDEIAAAHTFEMVSAHQRAVAWTRDATHRSTLDTLRRAQAFMTADRMERMLSSLGNLNSRDDLAKVYASAIAERDRAQTGLLPPSTRRPDPKGLGARPVAGFRDRQRPGQQREAGNG